MRFQDFINENKGAIAFTLLVLIAGTLAYIAWGAKDAMGASKVPPEVFNGIKYKVAYTPEGAIKVFANAKNNGIAKLSAVEGNNIPEDGSMIIGSAESDMMREEKLFAKPGDNLKDFFGLEKIAIGGVLAKTGTFVDDLHFLKTVQFDAIKAESGKVFSKLTQEGVPKLFFTLGIGAEVPQNFKLAEGSMGGYIKHDLGGVEAYPLVLGSNEAKMMRGEKLFSKSGDMIRGFFGKNVVIVGVLEETNTSLDMMHFVPLNEYQLG